ncbi:MAG: hypothetical protein ACFFD4_08280 [Candidatus Odinarchaeota archaeon]
MPFYNFKDVVKNTATWTREKIGKEWNGMENTGKKNVERDKTRKIIQLRASRGFFKQFDEKLFYNSDD